jgi:hypothetical protein
LIRRRADPIIQRKNGSAARRGEAAGVPLYEDLVRRTLAARERAEDAQRDSKRVRELAQMLRDANAGKTLLLHCAWCNKLHLGDEWLELEAVGKGSVQIANSLIRKSSHGICPECFQRVSEEADANRGR